MLSFLVVVWRRPTRLTPGAPEPKQVTIVPLRFGNCSFDVSRQILTAGNTLHKLTYREAKLLGLLVNHANQVLDRDTILKLVWEDEGVTVGRSVDVFMSRLRKLLHDDPTVRIAAVHGVGYKLEVDLSASA